MNRREKKFLEESKRSFSRLSNAIALIGTVACLVAGGALIYQSRIAGLEQGKPGCSASDMSDIPPNQRNAAVPCGNTNCDCVDCLGECSRT